MQTEGEYEATLSAFNPIDGWFSSPSAKVEVLEPIGPIAINDGSQYTDKVYHLMLKKSIRLLLIFYLQNENRMFTITLEFVGKKACIVFNAGDESDDILYGNPETCEIRYPEAEVRPLDLENKTIILEHLYV